MVLSMERWVGKVAVVTGASSGIGAAIAKQLAENGLLVVGVARRKERIEDLAETISNAEGKLIAYQADLSNHEEIKPLFNWISDNVGPVAILVNNAGTLAKTSIIDGDVDAWKKVIDLNLTAACIASNEAISIMKEHNIDGHIININSILGHIVMNLPNFNVYPATKHAITAISDTLRYELVNLNLKIKVSSISPGVVDTEIFQNTEKSHYEHIKKNMLNSEDIADGVVYALSTPPHVQVKELIIKPLGEPL